MIKYSIVVPVYRVEAYLSACIDSVLAQNQAAEYEIILVDDGSPDRSGVICDEYAARNVHVQVHHIENQGVSHARNLGIKLAQGEYVIFLDADDYWEPDFLQTMDAITKDSPDMAAVECARVFDHDKKEVEHIPVIPEGEKGEKFLNRLFAINATPLYYSVCYAYRREFLLDNQLFFPEQLKVSEDFVQIMDSIQCASSIIGCNRPVYNYRIHGNSATSSVTLKKLMDNLTTKAEYFHKYPNAAMANMYANNALLIICLTKDDRAQVQDFLKKNRKIWTYVSIPALKLGCILVTCFGDYYGAVIFAKIRRIVRKLQGK